MHLFLLVALLFNSIVLFGQSNVPQAILAENGLSLNFPAGFHKGVAISAFQNGGERYGLSNWGFFEETFIHANAKTMFGPAIKGGQKVGVAADFWNRAFDDIQLLKELGCNAFRFSVEWAEIEPEQGVFNEEVLAFYEQFCKELIRNDIIPMVTLHHFTHPQWFEDLGGWTNAENNLLFVNFAIRVFDRLSEYVPFWCTINEPTVVAACGYVLGIHPPGKCLDFKTSGTVLYNLLNAHVQTYHALKARKNGANVQIGIVHQMLQAEPFDPNYSSLYFVGKMRELMGMPLANFLNSSFAHDVTKEFLRSGSFEYHMPLVGVHISEYNANAVDSYDFVGLNFYSKVIFGPGPTCYNHQYMTDMDYPARSETIYDAIVEMSELGKPIYVTENGVADKADIRRAGFIVDYLAAVRRAVFDGYDVRGYYYWTFMDNFEWNDGYDMKFGLYYVDYKTQKRTLRNGALPFKYLFTVG